MVKFFLAILLAVQSFLVAARPWFVPTKTWANNTALQNGRRSFNYTAILESHHRLQPQSLNATTVNLKTRSLNETAILARAPANLTVSVYNATSPNSMRSLTTF